MPFGAFLCILSLNAWLRVVKHVLSIGVKDPDDRIAHLGRALDKPLR